MANKSCPQFHCTNVIKNGVWHGRQRYLCRDCGCSWQNTTRPQRFSNRLWKEYAFELRTLKQLVKQYGKSRKWIQSQLNAYEAAELPMRSRPVTIIMDVTYFSSWGVLVALDPYAKTGRDEYPVVYYNFIESTEKTADYEACITELQAQCFTIQAAVIDGRRGVRDMLLAQGIPVQQCQFHQLQTITQCLTKNPKLEPNKQLREIALCITKTTERGLTAALDLWYEQYGEWLKERYREPITKHLRYQHSRTRRAYFSLRRNLPYLFTYQDQALAARGIKLPNTTNALDGSFGVWKTKLKVHRGCSKTLKTKILRSFFSRKTD
jgi:hypothetical protein